MDNGRRWRGHGRGEAGRGGGNPRGPRQGHGRDRNNHNWRQRNNNNHQQAADNGGGGAQGVVQRQADEAFRPAHHGGGNGDHRQQPRGQRQEQPNREAYPISNRKLDELLHRSANDLVMELQLNPGWKCRLEATQASDVNDLSIVIRTFQKCLESINRSTLLGFLRDSYVPFQIQLLGSIAFLIDRPDAQVAALIYDILELILGIVVIIPTTSFQSAKTLIRVIQPSLDSLENRLRGKSRTLADLVKEIELQADSVRANEQFNKKAFGKPQKRRMHGYVVEGTAPDDFRNLDIFPSMADIQNERPFLRPNKKLGSYENGLEYVDTQFRLLREDFVKPIRDGINSYLSLPAERRKKELRGQSVRYYWNVSYRGRIAALTNQVFAFALQLSSRDYKTVNWERSKRFANGAVIGLSRDDFETMIFAVIIQRDVEMLKRGVLSVECCRTEDEAYMEAGQVYSVVESTALFEAYRYNLQVLQELDTDKVPFEKYLVHVDRDIGPLELIQQGRSINLKPIMMDKKDKATVASNKLNWPSRKQTILDDAQYEAVQSAFLRELCLIQGPPGTGKTFVGLLIVETMLLNHLTTKPILVVCYTNHALDQFLEGILQFTTQVVRVGGMCKSDAVNQYNLSELRVKQRDSGVHNHDLVWRNARRIRYRVAQLRKDINHKQEIANQALGKLIPTNALDVFSWGLIRDQTEVHRWLDIEKRTREFIQRERDETQQRADEERRKAERRRMQQDGQDQEHEQHEERMEALRRMQEEYQSDEEVDLLDDGRDENEDQNDQRTVVERLLALGDRKPTRGQDKYLEFELVANERPRLTETQAYQLMQQLEVHGQMSLTIDQRWDLYRHWHLSYVRQLEGDTSTSRDEYSEAFQSLKEMEAEMDLVILRGARIIGMTTTGAAKYKSLYERLNLEVVVVEEAAELLESHIVTTLSDSTKHLIMIGDHQQLRPTTTDYTLASQFNLEISLFERLIDNGLPFVRLKIQHRMRPEFVNLLVPHIYPSLNCGERVLEYPHIRGMVRDLQLMHHTEWETNDSENRSKSNKFECEIIVRLVQYLLLQGYSCDQITVLAMYSGQQFLIKQAIRSWETTQNGVRITSVDNYQGEENDIVIVSFVRSNVDDHIGFLKTLNRLCVAFSRARHGLFCVGNFTMISGKQPTFANILESVKESVDNCLKLRCQIHNRVTRIVKPRDFDNVSEGGCGELCEYRLQCGHACPRQCHVYDVEHLKIRCARPCAKKYPDCGHDCSQLCGVPCGRCRRIVDRRIDKCGHIEKVECGIPLDEIQCQHKCERLLPCGDLCPRKCFQACASECQKKIQVQGLCGHRVETICAWRNEPEKILEICKEPCGVPLVCQHICEGTCGSCYQGRLHVPCTSRCDKTLICGHVCKEPCSEVCPPCQRKCDNACSHSRCHKRCGEPCPPCVEPCNRRCDHQKCGARCSERCTKDPCTEPCPKKLKCGHPCIGFCTDQCPKKCRTCLGDENLPDVALGTEDEESRYVQLDCGHVIEADGMAMWVKTCLESNEISMGGITCPACKASVKKCNRYLQHINAKRRLIEQVKSKAFGSPQDNAQSLENLWKEIFNADNGRGPDVEFGVRFRPEYSKYSANDPLLADLQKQMKMEPNADQMKIQQWTNLLQIVREVRRLMPNVEKVKAVAFHWESFLKTVRIAIEQRVGQQQLDDMKLELYRFDGVFQFYTENKYSPNNEQVKACLPQLSTYGRYSEEVHRSIRDRLKEVRRIRTGGTQLNITEDERVMILNAMQLRQGHWYQCPNGHVYCIANCGLANQDSICPECKVPIGGQRYTLNPGNRAAYAMTGHAAPR